MATSSPLLIVITPIITTLAVGGCIIAIADSDHHDHHHARGLGVCITAIIDSDRHTHHLSPPRSRVVTTSSPLLIVITTITTTLARSAAVMGDYWRSTVDGCGCLVAMALHITSLRGVGRWAADWDTAVCMASAQSGQQPCCSLACRDVCCCNGRRQAQRWLWRSISPRLAGWDAVQLAVCVAAAQIQLRSGCCLAGRAVCCHNGRRPARRRWLWCSMSLRITGWDAAVGWVTRHNTTQHSTTRCDTTRCDATRRDAMRYF